MILNENLVKSIRFTKSQSEAAYDAIIDMFNSTPVGDWANLTSNKVLHIETCGIFNGEFGFWNISAQLDDSSRIAELKATFSGERSSRKPYADEYLISLTAPVLSNAKKQTLVTLTQSRCFNYRYSCDGKKNLTVRDIAKLSKPVQLYSFTLNLCKDSRTGKYYLSSTENAGKNNTATETASINVEKELLEA